MTNSANTTQPKDGTPTKIDAFQRFLDATKFFVEQNDGTKGIILNDLNTKPLKWAVKYFSRRKTCSDSQIDRSKGILLIGPVGSFKTTFMRIMQKLMKRKHQFAMVTTAKIVSEYNRTDKDDTGKPYGGETALVRFGQAKEYCFDELGEESEGKYYGSTMNVMKEIILIRYKLFAEEGVRTHFTSNTSLYELKKLYGERAADRLDQMINVVVLPKGTGFRSKSKPLTPPDTLTKPELSNDFEMTGLTEERRAEILANTNAMLEKINQRSRTYRHSGNRENNSTQ